VCSGGVTTTLHHHEVTEETVMSSRFDRFALGSVVLASAALAACSSHSSAPASTTTTTPTTANSSVKPSLAAPVPVSPLSGESVATRPVLTVANAVRTGTITGTVTYTFDVADNPAFSPLAATGSASEGASMTAFTLTTDLAGGKTYYWRAAAIDVADGLTSPASSSQAVTTVSLSTAAKIASQENPPLVLWPGTQPPGTSGQANLGDGWGIVSTADFLGNPFVSPTLENLRVFDLLDHGMNPNAVLGWMQSNGYNTSAVYYGNVAQGVFGFSQNYLTLIGTSWSLVKRVGA
jgi:hypothetical protein